MRVIKLYNQNVITIPDGQQFSDAQVAIDMHSAMWVIFKKVSRFLCENFLR